MKTWKRMMIAVLAFIFMMTNMPVGIVYAAESDELMEEFEEQTIEAEEPEYEEIVETGKETEQEDTSKDITGEGQSEEQTEEKQTEAEQTTETVTESIPEEPVTTEEQTESMEEEETQTTAEEIVIPEGYFFTGYENISIEQTGDLQIISQDDAKLQFNLTLSGYESEQAEIFPITYVVREDGEELYQGEYTFSSNISVGFSLYLSKPGELTISFYGQGIVYEEGEYVLQTKEIGYFHCLVEKQTQQLRMKQDAFQLEFGQTIALSDLVELSNDQEISRRRMCINETGSKNGVSILQIDNDSIRCIGMNGEDYGETFLECYYLGSAFYKESNVIRIPITVNKVSPSVQLQVQESYLPMYGILDTEITFLPEKNEYKDLLLEDRQIAVSYELTAESGISQDLGMERVMNAAHKFKKWVTPLDFFPFQKGKRFILRAKPVYQGDFSPYYFEEQETELIIGSCNAKMKVTIDKGGYFDYREDLLQEVAIKLEVQKDSIFWDKEISEEEKKQLQVSILSSNEKVIRPLQNSSQNATQKKFFCKLEGVGEAVLTIQITGGEIYEFEEVQIPVHVSDSDLRQEDIRLIYIDDNQKETLGSDSIQKILQKRQNWLNGTLQLQLSETGNAYYDEIMIEADGKNRRRQSRFTFQEELPIKEYEYWLINEERNANTSLHENGKNSLVFGIDHTTPILENVTFHKQDYKPGRKDRTFYYGENFWIRGTFYDEYSGIEKIQYATNSLLSNWTDIETDWKRGVQSVEFEITLGHGYYETVAIRCMDVAGNISDVFFVEDQGSPISIIVDDTMPELSVSTTVQSRTYQGEWTNHPIITEISEIEQFQSIAGILEIQAQYVKIGETYHDDNWVNITDLKQMAGIRANVSQAGEIYTITMGGTGRKEHVNQNGTYYYRAISRSGVTSDEVQLKKNAVRVKQQQTMNELPDMKETGGDKYHKNEWFNKKSGVPVLSFSYPVYEDGSNSKEYQAPVTLHTLIIKKDEQGKETSKKQFIKKGICSESDYQKFLADGKTGLLEEDLTKLEYSFGYDNKTGYAEDGIYTISYWMTDEAGNESVHKKKEYKVDTHEPEQLKIYIDGKHFEQTNPEVITYQEFYQNSINGEATAEFGISGRGQMRLLKAKKAGNWEQQSDWITLTDTSFSLSPNLRCFFYLEAEDLAGNKAELWTNGVVLDQEAPTGENGPDFIIKPEGANQNGFFHEDIDVDITVLEAPTDDNFSGIETVICRVGADKGTGKEETVFSFSNETPTYDEIENARSFAKTILVNAEENESNFAYIEVTAKDKCGNEAKSMETIKIDVTKPEIEIAFEDGDAGEQGNFYHHDRVAVLTIREKNFDPEGVEIHVKRDEESIRITPGEWEHEEELHRTSILFHEDGDYEVMVKCKDLADNEAEELKVESFTIDQTMPVVTVTYDNDLVRNEKYYQNQRTATVTIVEHNFTEDSFEIISENALAIHGWEHNGDVHTTTISFQEDGHYQYQLNYRDMAGNEMEPMETEEFYIDTKLPVIMIHGIENNSANAGEIAPVVWIEEENLALEDVWIQVETGKGSVIEVESHMTQMGEAVEYILTNLSEQGDEIYYLTVKVTDLAGNTDEITFRYSLNRFGSTYDLTQMQRYVERWYNRSADLSDLEIIEMNVDAIEEFALYISRNGKLLQAQRAEAVESGQTDMIYYDVEESGNEQLGYTYRYLIYKENFAREGLYHIAFYSKDQAGNEVNNTISEKEAKIQFVIDNTVPMVVVNGIETGQIYNTDSKDVNVLVTDNCKLKAATIYLMNAKGEKVKEWNYLKEVMEGEILSLEIAGYDGKLSFAYQAMDMAGNEVVVLQKSAEVPQDFLITTNPVIQYIHSTKAKTSSVVMVLFTITAISTAVYKKEKKKKGAA